MILKKEDVSQGGQGAPLSPVFHQAITQHLQKPFVFLLTLTELATLAVWT